MPPSPLCSCLDNASQYSCQDHFCGPKRIQVYYPHHSVLDVIEFFLFGGHLILQFVLQGGSFAGTAGGKCDCSDS